MRKEPESVSISQGDTVSPIYALGFSCFRRLWYYLAFKYFGLERTSWKLFQKLVQPSKLDIYVFIFSYMFTELYREM